MKALLFSGAFYFRGVKYNYIVDTFSVDAKLLIEVSHDEKMSV